MSDDQEEQHELQDFTVGWSIKLQAFDAQHAAQKAHDLLRSRQPIQLSVYKGNSTKNPTKVIPELEEHVSAAIRRFLPTADVEIDNDGEEISVIVISDHFRDIPDDETRNSIVAGFLSSLPEKVIEHFTFECWTQGEHDQYSAGGDDWDAPWDDQPGGEGAGRPAADFDDAEAKAMDVAVSNPAFMGKQPG